MFDWLKLESELFFYIVQILYMKFRVEKYQTEMLLWLSDKDRLQELS